MLEIWAEKVYLVVERTKTVILNEKGTQKGKYTGCP